MSTPWLSSSSSGASSMALLSSPTVWNTQKENVVSAFFFQGGHRPRKRKTRWENDQGGAEKKLLSNYRRVPLPLFWCFFCCFESTSTSGSLMITWPSGVSGSLCPCLRFHGLSSTGRWKTRENGRARLFCESSGPIFNEIKRPATAATGKQMDFDGIAFDFHL